MWIFNQKKRLLYIICSKFILNPRCCFTSVTWGWKMKAWRKGWAWNETNEWGGDGVSRSGLGKGKFGGARAHQIHPPPLVWSTRVGQPGLVPTIKSAQICGSMATGTLRLLGFIRVGTRVTLDPSCKNACFAWLKRLKWWTLLTRAWLVTCSSDLEKSEDSNLTL